MSSWPSPNPTRFCARPPTCPRPLLCVRRIQAVPPRWLVSAHGEHCRGSCRPKIPVAVSGDPSSGPPSFVGSGPLTFTRSWLSARAENHGGGELLATGLPCASVRDLAVYRLGSPPSMPPGPPTDLQRLKLAKLLAIAAEVL